MVTLILISDKNKKSRSVGECITSGVAVQMNLNKAIISIDFFQLCIDEFIHINRSKLCSVQKAKHFMFKILSKNDLKSENTRA